ncbi:flavodoxin [Vibrio sp.]|uniref:flavodoxin n=1 Tax=Vibrio sp. TaxID=678 RepID=UPI00311E27FC
MDHSPNELLEIKNHWFSQHVEVDFPTKESLLGRELYLSSVSSVSCRQIKTLPAASTEYNQDDIFKVDFHRLTVMFAVLQAKRWNSEQEQALVVEFLSQIIFSEPCDLYVGFEQGQPSAAAVVTTKGDSILVSDVVTNSADSTAFLSTLLNHSAVAAHKYAQIFVESN